VENSSTSMNRNTNIESIWVFGYGSLIWKPDITYTECRRTRLIDWSRRFWQGSHDHRGTPDNPGRVVTLIPDPGSYCDGIAFEINPEHFSNTFESLDYREKNGYERHNVSLKCIDATHLSAVVYIATLDNFAWLGPESDETIAQQIIQSNGPSGSNTEYLLNLANSLRENKFHDDHVFELERLVLSTT